MDIIENAAERMDKTIAVLKRDLGTLRAGRANPQVLDRITVDYYGTPTPINQLGNISSPEPRMLMISLWDQKMISAVEKEIQKSDIGINPTNDGKFIRLIFPELTEERRKDLVKVIRKKGEEAKVAVRNHRREAMDVIKKLKTGKEISEDEASGCEADVEKTVSNYMTKLEGIISAKEKELMSI